MSLTGNSSKISASFPDDCPCIELIVGKESVGQRLDLFLSLSRNFGDGFSRAKFQELIRRNLVLVDNAFPKIGYRLRTNQIVRVHIPPPEPSELIPEKIDFSILHEDSDLIVISKPPGLVVHPACGNMTGTLVHGLLHHCQDLAGIGGELRPGIVHRLDKDTSGVMVIAKNDVAHLSLVSQFKNKKVRKTYHAILDGRLPEQCGRIVNMVGRHKINRKKMAVLVQGGKEAISCWKVLNLFAENFSFVEIDLQTGRTHQIRVHMAAMGAPVAGDSLYGRKNIKNPQLGISRQCLHASHLSFFHPGTGKPLTISAPIWPDMALVLDNLVRKV